MQLKSATTTISGLRHMVERLDLKSGLARRMLLSSPFLTHSKEIQSHLDLINLTKQAAEKGENKGLFDRLAIKLDQIRDIGGTIKNLNQKLTLNDIELFEIKSFSLLAEEIKELIHPFSFLEQLLPQLNEVLDIIDPDGQKIPSFYISNSFAPELTPLRKELERIELLMEQSEEEGNTNETGNLQTQSEVLREKIAGIKDQVRQQLSKQLWNHAPTLQKALDGTGSVDILIAKAKQATLYGMTMPRLSQEETVYQGLFHPQLRETLEQQGRRYQPIDITLSDGTCLVTGANMAGKTVLLKTLALSQALCQFGFFVPAAEATIAPVEQILFSITDEQSVLSGLSSYAAEMLTVNSIVQQAKKGKNLLILIDELARTTNPTEGRAIVSAVANILDRSSVKAVITTHYGNLSTQCRKLRVKGFMEQSQEVKITVKNIGNYIDYSLVEDDGKDVPHEALRIAEILGIDSEIVNKANKLLNK